MTTAKRALIVDDSRSARVILSRMLEQHGLTVDTAESAEQALEYLQRTRPDVIFMDHLMPGMDGFQAVQAIKADALTATIPLMMYTSQEGELYVSQARALGAVGVLPKTVRPVDVSRVLYQLHLLPDRRAMRTALFPGPAAAAAQAARSGFGTEASMAAALAAGLPESTAGAEAETTGPARAVLAAASAEPGTVLTPALLSELQVGLRASMHQMVKDQLAEQRRFMLATFEAFARRLTRRGQGGDRAGAASAVPQDLIPPEPPRQWWPVALTALLAVIPAAVLGVLTWQASVTNRSLAHDLADAQGVAGARPGRGRGGRPRPPTRRQPPQRVAQHRVPGRTAEGPVAGTTVTEYVPYGEAPLAGTRLDRLRAMAGTLEAQQFRGRIRVESFVGDFCLAGSATEGFAIAGVDLAVSKCDFVGNPFDDSLSPAQRQSLDFANFAAMLRQRTAGAIRVEVVNAGRTQPSLIRNRTRRRRPARGTSSPPRTIAWSSTSSRKHEPAGPAMTGAKLDFVPPRRLRHHHLQSIYPSLPIRRPGVERRAAPLLRHAADVLVDCGDGVRLLAHLTTQESLGLPPATRARHAAARLGRQRELALPAVARAAVARCGLRRRPPQPARSRRQPSPEPGNLPFMPHCRGGRRGAGACSR